MVLVEEQQRGSFMRWPYRITTRINLEHSGRLTDMPAFTEINGLGVDKKLTLRLDIGKRGCCPS